MTYLSRHRKRHNVRGIFNQRCGVPSCFARPCNDGFPADESLRNFVMQSVSTSGWQFACPAARLARPHPLPSTPLSFHPPSLTLPLPRSPRCKLNCTQNIRLPSSGKGNTGPAPNTSALQEFRRSSTGIRFWIPSGRKELAAVPRFVKIERSEKGEKAKREIFENTNGSESNFTNDFYE